MRRVYVAGPYSCEQRCPGPGVDLAAMREGINACLELIQHKMAPFCPWLDYLFVLMDKDRILPFKWYYEYSNSFLIVCDAVWVINQRENSIGVEGEIELAKKNNIPIFYSFTDLMES